MYLQGVHRKSDDYGFYTSENIILEYNNRTKIEQQQMQIINNKRSFQINFDSNNQVSKTSENEQEQDIINKFLQDCRFFRFPPVHNEEIEKFKKKVIAFAVQYGTRNEKTTSIFLNFLQNTREIATNQLKKKEYASACAYYAICLGFIDPDDEIFLEKFVITKIDIVNKMMYSIFELYSERNESNYLDWSLDFLEHFLHQTKQFAFYSNLIKSDACMIELNYFYLGRTHKKRKNIPKAIEALLKTQQIILEKKNFHIYQKNPQLDVFSTNLQAKTFYKISKCYRDDDPNEQAIYEGLALKIAEKSNPSLYQYINKKIRMYKSSKQFNEVLAKLEGKKKIQEQFLRRVEEANQKQIHSLYDVYLDNHMSAIMIRNIRD